MQAKQLVAALSELADRATTAAADLLREAAEAHATAEAAVRLAAEQLKGPIPGIGGEPWRLLWQAARAFVAGEGGSFPPGDGQPCPLCLQPVTENAATRMAHFDGHVSSSVRAAATNAAAALSDALAECAPAHAEACRAPLLPTLRDREPALAKQIGDLIDALAGHLDTMQAEPATATAAQVDITPAVTALTVWANGRTARAHTLLATDDPEMLQRVKSELAELEARERLAGELDVLAAWRARLRIIDALDRAHSALATNRITTAQRELTETQISKALDAALTEELERLSCTHLPVQLSTRTAVAETKVRLRLLANEPVEVAEILSEGERRALALCFFFAELAVVNDGGGIIVDDPVSSLDDERRRYIGDRLVTEAQRRQVIVFTHDLPFLLDLQTQAEAAGMPLLMQGMWRMGNVVGRVDDSPPFKAMNLKARIGNLRQRVAEWDSEPRPAGQDEAWRRVTSFYSDLRTAWERAVEERLFQGAVQRFQRAVKTQSLRNVEVTKELVQQVEEGMTRASMFLHDEPPGAAVRLPGRSELTADLGLLIQFEAQVKRK